MTLAAIVFGIMACFYKYVNQEICEDDKNTLVSSVGYDEEDETPVDEHEYMPIKKSSPLYVDEQ